MYVFQPGKNDTELIEALNDILDKNKEEDTKFDRSQMSILSLSSFFHFSGILMWAVNLIYFDLE